MHAVGREESVLDALAQTVGVDRVAEVAVGVAVVLAQRRRRHAELIGRLEVFKDLAPVALVAGAAAMALVDDDQVEEVGRVLRCTGRARLVLGDGLVDGEVHLAALVHLAVLDLPAGVAERRRTSCPSGRRPGCCGRPGRGCAAGGARRSRFQRDVPELPADLERHDRLAGARGHGEQDALLALQHGLHGAVDGDFLVVALALPMAGWPGSKAARGFVVFDLLAGPKALPQFGGGWKSVSQALLAGGKVELDDAMAIGRVGELQAEDSRRTLWPAVVRRPAACRPPSLQRPRA